MYNGEAGAGVPSTAGGSCEAAGVAAGTPARGEAPGLAGRAVVSAALETPGRGRTVAGGVPRSGGGPTGTFAAVEAVVNPPGGVTIGVAVLVGVGEAVGGVSAGAAAWAADGCNEEGASVCKGGAGGPEVSTLIASAAGEGSETPAMVAGPSVRV